MDWAKKRMRRTLSGAVLSAALTGLSLPGTAAELIMFEEQGCPWCEAWHREIGPIYPKTPEGRRAPLRQVDMHAPRPDDLAGIKAVRYSPTFVLVDRGSEVGRIQGYPGEDFFWGLLAGLIERLPTEADPQSARGSGQ